MSLRTGRIKNLKFDEPARQPHQEFEASPMKCDWCEKPASFWIRKLNYCGDCVATRLPENRLEQHWWPRVQQVGTIAQSSAAADSQHPFSVVCRLTGSGARAGRLPSRLC